MTVETVILAGGRGRRLAPYTTVFPKPLMPIGDMPVLEILLRRLCAAGFTRVHLAVGHLAELIEAYFGDGSRFGVELLYWREDQPLGTAGPLAMIESDALRYLVLNGDLFTTIDFGEVVAAHERAGAIASIAVRRREVATEFGVVHIEHGAVKSFEEKPVLAYDVSMGIYVFERTVLRWIERDTPLDFPVLLDRLLQAGERVAVHRSEDFWLDIGRPEDYEHALDSWDEMRAQMLGSS